jgi:putative AdoMet-dependent methyltransferase
VDFVVSQRALHHLPDFWKVQALERICAVLRPGGVLYLSDLVYSFDPHEAGGAIEEWIAGTAVEGGEGFQREFFEEHVREEYAPNSWLLEAMFERVGLEVREATYDSRMTYAAYTCLKPTRAGEVLV